MVKLTGMLDAVEQACLTLTDPRQERHYLNLHHVNGPEIAVYRSSAAMRHSLWLKVPVDEDGTTGTAHLCRCMAARLRDALNEMLAEPVDTQLECERFTPELKAALLAFENTCPPFEHPDSEAWHDVAEARLEEIFAQPGMLHDGQ